MGLTTQLRNTGRFVVFIVAVLSVVAVAGGSWFYLSSRYVAPGKPLEGRPALSFESPDDVYFSAVLRMRYAQLIAPAGTDDSPVSFVVEPGETASGIAARLEERGLISDADLFKTYVRFYRLDALV